MLELIKKTSIDFIGKRYYAFGLSGILVLLGIIAFVTVVLGKAKLGIDFSGGTMIQGNFEQHISISDLRAAMSRNGYTDAEIQELQREIPNSFLIRVKATSGTGGQVANQLSLVLEKEFPNNKFKTDSVDEVGPAVGKSLQSKARFAVLIFTSLLTLAGYSLTDTVVVFDRIRENLKLFRKRGDFPSLINASINEVLSRTIITSTTVFLVVTVLFFLGGEVVHDFALALMLGVIIGTYSSIFVASPLMVEWERKVPKRFK